MRFLESKSFTFGLMVRALTSLPAPKLRLPFTSFEIVGKPEHVCAGVDACVCVRVCGVCASERKRKGPARPRPGAT